MSSSGGVDERGNIVEFRTEAEFAQDLRDELAPLLDKACVVMAKAKAAGFGLSWNIQPDSFGRNFRVVEIVIVKPL